MNKKNKVLKNCIIINGKFSWLLLVDNQEIFFSGFHNAEYFKVHYENLGYQVLFIDKE